MAPSLGGEACITTAAVSRSPFPHVLRTRW